MANGDFFGVAGAGDSSCAVAGDVGCTAGTGAAVCAVAGFCCIAGWPAGGGGEALGGPALRASIILRKVSLSTVGVFVCAMRFLSEVTLVLGGFTLSKSSGSGMNVVSCFCWIGTMTGRLKFHFGIKISKAMMIAWVIREIHAASRRRYVETTSSSSGRSAVRICKRVSAAVIFSGTSARDCSSAGRPFSSITGINHHQPASRRYCVVSYYSLIRTAIVSCSCRHHDEKTAIPSGNYSLPRGQLRVLTDVYRKFTGNVSAHVLCALQWQRGCSVQP